MSTGSYPGNAGEFSPPQHKMMFESNGIYISNLSCLSLGLTGYLDQGLESAMATEDARNGILGIGRQRTATTGVGVRPVPTSLHLGTCLDLRILGTGMIPAPVIVVMRTSADV